jgi:hypothetical protein
MLEKCYPKIRLNSDIWRVGSESQKPKAESSLLTFGIMS